ncbi:hypothetical protein [[Flexibacter] sp. ATCC 35208]|uniref:hypothetical protein n=1 Tax=[Flexibacter] sp. ATCC 35208 TaxID=1936242 RepID=UPI00117E857F|nr:hypothetical protein [[Flexibacter] sp. ATCC 35208]
MSKSVRKLEYILGPKTFNEVQVGNITYTRKQIVEYYKSIGPTEGSLNDKIAKYLSTVAMKKVLHMPIYENQAELDKVFFTEVLKLSLPFSIPWVNDWKEVYQQFTASRIPFRDLILKRVTYQYRRNYKLAEKEVKNIRSFFYTMNMTCAVRMVDNFEAHVLSQSLCSYRFMAKQNPPALDAVKPAALLDNGEEKRKLKFAGRYAVAPKSARVVPISDDKTALKMATDGSWPSFKSF